MCALAKWFKHWCLWYCIKYDCFPQLFLSFSFSHCAPFSFYRFLLSQSDSIHCALLAWASEPAELACNHIPFILAPFFSFLFLSLLALMAVCFYPLFFLLSPSLKFDILSDICPLVTHAPPCSWSRLGQIHLKVSSVCVCVCSTLLLSVGWKCAPQE